MIETTTKPVPAESGKTRGATMGLWSPFESLRREIDHLFDDFNRSPWPRPAELEMFPWMGKAWGSGPAVDIAEKDGLFELTAELPGLDEKNVEVKVVDGCLTIKGEKQEEKEEESQGYQLKERRFGSFERSFALPEGVDLDKVDASFTKGVLKITLPKKPEAQKPEKKIAVKAA